MNLTINIICQQNIIGIDNLDISVGRQLIYTPINKAI